MTKRHRGALAAVAALLLAACSSKADEASSSSSPADVAELRAEVRETIEHDVGAFTEGLLFDPTGRLFESTGLVGESTVREVDPATGEVRRSTNLDDDLFGEGLALVGERLVMLTWQSERALVFDVGTFEQVGEFEYEGEGWGLCSDGSRLVMSNGSDTLTFRDPTTFAELGSVVVTNDGEPVEALNELECVDGEVYANIWKSDRIVRIDPTTGNVNAVIDAAGLPRPAAADVLNGIAVDPDGALWLTGKWWDAMYRVELVPSS